MFYEHRYNEAMSDESKFFSRVNFVRAGWSLLVLIMYAVLSSDYFLSKLGDGSWATAVRDFFASKTELNNGMLVLICLAAITFMWIIWPKTKSYTVPIVRGGIKSEDEDIVEPEAEPPTIENLTDEQVAIMRLMATGVPHVSSKDVSEKLMMQPLIADQSCDRLTDIGLLYDTLNMITGRHFHLSDMGRDFAIENDLIE